MKYYILITLSLCSLKTYGQIHNNYFAKANGDTLTIELTEKELLYEKRERMVELKHKTKKKKKKISENVSCELKLKNNDTTFWAGVADYYDDYFIALIGTIQQKSKNEYTIIPIGFRRIKLNEIEWVMTSGKKNIMSRLLLSGAFLCIGSSLTILSIKDDFNGEEDPFPPALIPVGLGLAYIGIKLFDDVITKTYYLHEWNLEIKEKKRTAVGEE